MFIHPSCGKNDDQDSFISGVLRVIEKVFVQCSCRTLLHLLAKLMCLRNCESFLKYWISLMDEHCVVFDICTVCI